MSKEAKVAWDYLKANLDNQVVAYSRLTTLLRQENKALIERNHQSLINVSNQKEILTPEIFELQTEMSSIMNKIVVSESSSIVSLQQVIAFSPEQFKQEFSKSRGVLMSQKKEIMLLQYRNQKLMENALKYIQHIMNKVMDIRSDNQQVYSKRGSTNVLGDSRNWMDIVA
ncbi:MAG: flagellar export chaperone FlgN [Candidatus Margulisbacteria bacterium]|nr:flagellar export chaperone FlgN [Candidatus Margulisiibacteriota bacterium]